MKNPYIDDGNMDELYSNYENPGRLFLETALTQMPAAYA